MSSTIVKSLIVVSCIILGSIVICCNKPQLNEIPGSHFSEEAKRWFETRNTSKYGNSISVSNMNKTISPKWENATDAPDKNYEVLEVPIEEESNTQYVTNIPDGRFLKEKGISPNGITRLLITKNKKNQEMEAVLMRIIADSETSIENLKNNTYLKKDKDFTGFIIFTNLNKVFVNGWYYRNGKVFSKVNFVNKINDDFLRKTPKQIGKVNGTRLNPDEPPPGDTGGGSGGCTSYKIDEYERVCTYYTNGSTSCSGWTYTGNTYYYQTGCNLISSSSGSLSENGGYGDNPTLLTCTNDICKDSAITNNVLLDCIFKNLEQTHTFDSLVNAFKNSGSYDLQFNVKPVGSNAQTQFVGFINSSGYPVGGTAVVSLSSNYIQNNTNTGMNIVRSVLHEVWHAQLYQQVYEVYGITQVNALEAQYGKMVKNMTLYELIELLYVDQNGNKTINSYTAIASNWTELEHHNYMTKNIDVLAQGIKEFLLNGGSPMWMDSEFCYALALSTLSTYSTYFINNVYDYQSKFPNWNSANGSLRNYILNKSNQTNVQNATFNCN